MLQDKRKGNVDTSSSSSGDGSFAYEGRSRVRVGEGYRSVLEAGTGQARQRLRSLPAFCISSRHLPPTTLSSLGTCWTTRMLHSHAWHVSGLLARLVGDEAAGAAGCRVVPGSGRVFEAARTLRLPHGRLPQNGEGVGGETRGVHLRCVSPHASPHASTHASPHASPRCT